MLIILTSLLIFAAITLAAYAFYVESTTAKSPVSVRLRAIRDMRSSSSVGSYSERPPLLMKLLATLGGFLPASDGRDALRTGLIRAGYRQSEAVLIFLGSKVVLAAALPLTWILVGYSTARPLGNVFVLAVVLAIVGFYLPTIFIAMRQRQRSEAVATGLPDALDLMVTCVEAGLGIAAALQRVGVEMRIASPELSAELALVNQEMQTGISRTDALRNLAERTGVDDVYSLVAMLIQTDRLGTSIAQALRAHAESMRTRRRQRAEQLARKASVKLAFPLVLLIFPALMLVLLGPALVELMRVMFASAS
jgi:tight adherence protein C